MDTKTQYKKLRSEWRNWRRQLPTNPVAFERCLVLNAWARHLTGEWETGFCSPIPRNPYARKGSWNPICTPALSKFLAK